MKAGHTQKTVSCLWPTARIIIREWYARTWQQQIKHCHSIRRKKKSILISKHYISLSISVCFNFSNALAREKKISYGCVSLFSTSWIRTLFGNYFGVRVSRFKDNNEPHSNNNDNILKSINIKFVRLILFYLFILLRVWIQFDLCIENWEIRAQRDCSESTRPC